MIGKLQGIVDHVGNDYVIVMVSGVGYKVYCPEMLTPGSAVSLWIETVVREDSFRLFGFTTLGGQELFNQLISVSGVGPKGAMSILGTLKPDVLLSAIATGDAKTIATAPGVGKKVAEKIIVELKGKASAFGFAFDTNTSSNNLADLLSALETLGYRRIDIVEMAQKLVNENPEMDVTKLVPLALKVISGK